MGGGGAAGGDGGSGSGSGSVHVMMRASEAANSPLAGVFRFVSIHFMA